MNTTALATIQGDELEVIQRTAKLLAASGYFGTANDGVVGMAQVAAKILAGRELGFGPFAAVNGIHIIQGKPTVGANLMAAAVRAHPRYDYRVKELTDKACELEFIDSGKVAGVSRFTVEDAQTAELSTGRNSGTWKKFPRNMLFARAMSNGVRFYAPDIFSGNAVYVPEELDVSVDGDGNVVDATFIVTPQNATDGEYNATAPQHSAATANALQGAPVPASGDDAPTDAEHDIISQWDGPRDAQNWAMMVGACENEHHASQSWIASVKACGGYSGKNKREVFTHFLRHQHEKMGNEPVAA